MANKANKGFGNERLEEILEELQKESDRACAIIGAAFLEELLGRLLKATLIDETPSSLFGQSLRDFAPRIEFAFAIGLLTKSDCNSLNAIRMIRNTFAHRIDQSYTFETPEIHDEIIKIEILDQLREWCKDNGGTYEDAAFLPSCVGKTGNRTDYMKAVFLLGMMLEKREKFAKKFIVFADKFPS